MEHVQKIIYLLSLFLPVMVFFTLGLWFAWMKWFKHCRSFNEAMDEHHQLVEKLNFLYTNQTSLSEKYGLSPAPREVEIQEPSEVVEEVSTDNTELTQLQSRIEEIESAREKEALELVSLREENAALNKKLAQIVDTSHDDTFSGIDMMETILNDFADEHVSNDAELGILFQEKPDKVDDLTVIDLISPEIASKINKLGIYRYRQIALWTYDQFDQILAKIGTNPNHVIGKNGQWQKEAAKLHKKNY